MNTLCRGLCLCVVGLSIFGWVAPSSAQHNYEYVRRGSIAYIRAIQLPPLIEKLANTPEPMELSLREFAQLKAYLVATSRPKRMEKDQFYRHNSDARPAQERTVVSDLSDVAQQHTTSSAALEDPINESRMFPKLRRAVVWERLRMHFVYNEELQKSTSYRTSYETTRRSGAVQRRETVAVQMGSEVRWFAVDDCLNNWKSRQPSGGTLYLVAPGRFVLLDPNTELKALPARSVSTREAVTWLAIQGYAMPSELAQSASKWQWQQLRETTDSDENDSQTVSPRTLQTSRIIVIPED